MAYIFHQDELPKLVSVVPGRERVFFVNKELAGMDDMLAGIMRYKKGAASPYHLHENCEHFYFIMDGAGTVETPDGVREVKTGRAVAQTSPETRKPDSISSGTRHFALRERIPAAARQ